jgi:hypothetical protein
VSKPGEIFDKKGVPIYPGDLIRSFHFRGARRKIYYLYHVAVLKNGRMWMVPTCYLDPTIKDTGGRCYLEQNNLLQAEVISGHGPEPYSDHEDRPRRKIEKDTL